MGGPCKLLVPGQRLKKYGPACTDNFQVKPFLFEGLEWQSCEQAYQGYKFNSPESREAIRLIVPWAGETDGCATPQSGLSSNRQGGQVCARPRAAGVMRS